MVNLSEFKCCSVPIVRFATNRQPIAMEQRISIAVALGIDNTNTTLLSIENRI